MRLFISIDTPQAVTDECTRIQKIVRSYEHIKGTFTKEMQLHCTLLFLGEVSEEDAPKIIEKLGTITFPSCTLSLGHLDVNSWAHPQVVWISLRSELLDKLDSTLRNTLGQPDTRPFRPHITLMRIKELTHKSALKKLVQNVEVQPLEWTVTEFCLYESILSKEGSCYKQLCLFPLE